jgi:adenylate cyclase, class 2
MPTEYEAKILEVDIEAAEARIEDFGGTFLGEALMRRYVYDIVPGDQSRWLRLRDNGSQTTIAVKQIAHDGIDGTDETEIVADDFDTAARLLELIGKTPKGYQENRRRSWRLGDCAIEIDTWPMIPTYMEIEGPDVRSVTETAHRLGYDPETLTGANTTKIYASYGLLLEDYPDLRFEAPTDAMPTGS